MYQRGGIQRGKVGDLKVEMRVSGCHQDQVLSFRVSRRRCYVRTWRKSETWLQSWRERSDE